MIELAGLAGQVIPHLGMGDRDEGGDPFPDAATEELGDPVFGHHRSDVGSAGDHAGAGCEDRDDSGDRTAGCDVMAGR